MKSESKKITFTIETNKIVAKKRKIGKDWKIKIDINGAFIIFKEKPVLPDELFEI